MSRCGEIDAQLDGAKQCAEKGGEDINGFFGIINRDGFQVIENADLFIAGGSDITVVLWVLLHIRDAFFL